MNDPNAVAELLLKLTLTSDVNARTADSLTLLHIAVEEERYDVAKRLLVNGADVNAAREDTLTPIHIAASSGHKHLAELLLKAGANVNAQTVESKTPLHLAVGDLPVEPRNTVKPKKKYLYLTKLLLSYGANVNAKTAESNTPLHIAIRCNHVGLIPLLLKYRADVDAEDGRGCTPLYLAVESGYPKMLSYILKSRPDVNNKSNQSALSIAVRRQSDNEIIKKLLHYGIPVKPEDATNRSIVSCVIRNGFTKTATEIFRYGTTTGLDFDWTPLHVATIYRRKAIVKVLVGHGADVNAKDFAGRTPIYFATLNADYDLVELFLSKNATVRDNLVHLAARSGSLKILRVLLKLCDVNCRDEKRRTALHCVNISVEPVQMSIPVAHSFKQLPLSPIDFVSRTEIARFLLANGADVNARDMNGQTPLHVAVKEGLESIVKVLLVYQADLNPVDDRGKTALDNSIKPESLDVTRLLLKAGATVNTQPGKPSPLHEATKAGCRNHVQLLLEYGANVDAVREGDTALHIASRRGDLSIVKVLLEYYADVNARGKEGTPLHTAALNGHKGIVSHLLLYGSDINIGNKDNLTPLECVSKLFFRDVLSRIYLVNLMAAFIVLLEGVVRVKCLGLFVAEANLAFLTSESPLMTQFKTFYDWSSRLSDLTSKCEAEIAVMRAETIGDSSVTYYDFVAKSGGQVVRLLANASIVETLSSGLYSDQFPTYASMIRSKSEVGMRRRNALHTFLGEGAVSGLTFSALEERIKCLIALGADVNARNSRGDTPIFLVFTRYSLASPIVRTLLEYGADVNAIGHFGPLHATPLHIACAYHKIDFVKLLLEYGADVNVTCGENITPLDCTLNDPFRRDSGHLKHCPELRYGGVPYCLLPPDEDNMGDFDDRYELLFLLRHLVKMKSADLYLSEANMDYFREEPEPYFNLDECEELYEVLEELPPKCDAEIAEAKQAKVGGSDVSYYDVVAAGPRELAHLSKNKTLLEGLRSGDYEQRFPIYADMIGWNYKRAERIKRARNVGYEFLRTVLVNLPDLCVYEILSYLPERDLLLLLSAELTATPAQGSS